LFVAFPVCFPFCAAPPPPLLRGRGGRAWLLTAAAAQKAAALEAAARIASAAAAHLAPPKAVRIAAEIATGGALPSESSWADASLGVAAASAGVDDPSTASDLRRHGQ
jgi:hypothetical protein